MKAWRTHWRPKIRNLAAFTDRVILAGLFQAANANRQVDRDIDAASKRDYEEAVIEGLCEEILLEAFQDSTERLRRVEDNSRSTLVGATLAGTLMGITINIFGPGSVIASTAPSLRLISGLAVVLVMFFFVTSGIFALKGYEVGVVYRPLLESPGFTRSESDRRIELLHCIRQNDLMLVRRSNLLVVAMKCLRNGLLTLLAFHSFILIISVFK